MLFRLCLWYVCRFEPDYEVFRLFLEQVPPEIRKQGVGTIRVEFYEPPFYDGDFDDIAKKAMKEAKNPKFSKKNLKRVK